MQINIIVMAKQFKFSIMSASRVYDIILQLLQNRAKRNFAEHNLLIDFRGKEKPWKFLVTSEDR